MKPEWWWGLSSLSFYRQFIYRKTTTLTIGWGLHLTGTDAFYHMNDKVRSYALLWRTETAIHANAILMLEVSCLCLPHNHPCSSKQAVTVLQRKSPRFRRTLLLLVWHSLAEPSFGKMLSHGNLTVKSWIFPPREWIDDRTWMSLSCCGILINAWANYCKPKSIWKCMDEF